MLDESRRGFKPTSKKGSPLLYMGVRLKRRELTQILRRVNSMQREWQYNAFAGMEADGGSGGERVKARERDTRIRHRWVFLICPAKEFM